jgi:hypothetical protein
MKPATTDGLKALSCWANRGELRPLRRKNHEALRRMLKKPLKVRKPTAQVKRSPARDQGPKPKSKSKIKR